MSGSASDSLGVADALASLAERLGRVDGAVEGMAAGGRAVADAIANPLGVTVLASGGAAVAAQLVAAVGLTTCPVPIVVHEHGPLPGHVGRGTLVLVASVSPGDPEVVAATEAALASGATVAGVTPDGVLRQVLHEAGAPTVEVAPAPTARLGAFEVALALAAILGRAGLLTHGLAQPGPVLDAIRTRLDEDRRPGGSDELARRIGRAIPVVQGVGPLGGAAARWWKHELNLSAKVPSWWGAVPPVTHDEVAGWGQHGDVTRQVLHLITLRHDHEPPGSSSLVAELDGWQLEVVGALHEVRAAGGGPLAQGIDLALQGALAAVRIAVRNDVDPGPAPVAERFSARSITNG